MKNLNKFIADYTADMEADNRRFIDLMFQPAIIIKIDLSCIDRIMQGIEDDQPRFDKWCEVMAKNNKMKRIRFVAFATISKQTNHSNAPINYAQPVTTSLRNAHYAEHAIKNL